MGCAIQEIINENPKTTKNHYSQQPPTTLKSQHTALVKLLESAPISGGSKSKTVTNYTSPRQQQQTTTSNHKQPQQIKSNNDTSSIRISNNVKNVCDVVSKTNSCISNNHDESGIDEDIGDDSDNKVINKEKNHTKLLNNNSNNKNNLNNSSNNNLNSNSNTKNQCPWKKIRYAREWKQRELLSDENSNNSNLNEISKCDNTELTKRLILEEQDQQEQHHPHHHHQQQQQHQQNHLQQTAEDIASQIQNHRRDSSDSNSSVASVSCTCGMPQDNEILDEDCECQQDSGCDDEMNGGNGTMNYLCQKFNDVILLFFYLQSFFSIKFISLQ